MRLSMFIACALTFCVGVVRGAGERDTLQLENDSDLGRTLELASEEGSAAPLADLLDGLQEHPVDLNRASVAELQQIPGVSPLLAYKIISQRNEHAFESKEELSRVEGITPSIIRELDPFITVRGKPSSTQSNATEFHFRTRAVQTMSVHHGVTQQAYPASPQDVYSKLTARIGDLRGPSAFGSPEPEYLSPSVLLGVVTSKDPGEKNYLDFVSGYVFASAPSLATRLLVGDFQLEAGQGLVFWRSMGFSKGAEATANVGRNGVGLRPSLSSAQSWSFRGAGAEVVLEDFSFCLFYSHKPFDAAEDSDGTISSIDLDGYHRTEADFQKRNRVSERVFGGRVCYTPGAGLRIGASGFRAGFDRMISFAGPFGFKGADYYVIGTDLIYTRSSISGFAELAQDYEKKIAGVIGMLLCPRADLTLALLARAYPKDFKNPHGSGFGERGSSDGDESGLYCGLTYHYGGWMMLSAYYDQFAFPWPTSTLSLPAIGSEILCQTEFDLANRTRLEFRYRQKEKMVNASTEGSDALPDWGDVVRQQRDYRATITVGSSRSVVWTSRFEAVTVGYPSRELVEHGALAFQDFSFSLLPRLTIRLRGIAYETDSYDSRVYEFEEDSPGTYLDPALSGKGFRWYVIARYERGHWFGISLKFSQTRSEGRRAIAGEVLNVSGDLENRWAVQVDLRL